VPDSRIAFDYKARSGESSAATHARWFITGIMLPVAGGLLAYMLAKEPVSAPTDRAASAPSGIAAALPTLETPVIPDPTVPPPLGDTIEFVVRRNDTLDRIFRQLELSLNDLASIRDVPGVRERLDQLRPGDTIKLTHEEGAVHALSRRISDTEVLSVTRSENGFAAEVIATPVELRTAHAHGVIDSSLFVAARAAGVNAEMIMQLANEIFGWKIDFALEIQPGDRFDIVYEQKYRNGEYIGDGRILGADFTNDGTLYRAVYFRSADGKIADYFAPDGRSMHRQFLRAPLDFTRISSTFSVARLHPILNTIRAHKGVDYAAPTGTVIKVAGEGRVSFVGIKGGYGKVVIVEHGAGISTLYGHMSRFAKGLRVGQRVNQADTIGYVGMTGAATGPHLHYEYRINGVHQNPRTVKLPDAAPISAQYLEEFQTRAGTMLAELDKTHDGVIGAASSAASPAP
jgi:murein DD-endopeptidase MepM/ murein hydrolase activator NlpD